MLLVGCSLDRVGPVVEMDSMQGPVSGTVQVAFSAHDVEPGVAAVEAVMDESDAVVVGEGTVTVDTTDLEDGEHTLTLRVRDGALFSNTTTVRRVFVVDNTPPNVQVEDLDVAQGRAGLMRIRGNEPLSAVQVEACGQTVEGLVAGQRGWAPVACRSEHPVGGQVVQVRVVDVAGNERTAPGRLEVTAVDYPESGFIQLTDAQVRARQDDTSRADAEAQRAAAFAQSTGAPHWSGTLAEPVRGVRTSGFGKLRVYSDGARQVHGGLDIAAPTGTPVIAPVDGVVTLAEPLAIYGNAIVLAHGLGLSTSYSHLSAIDVAAGDTVTAGQRIGAVGSTGQSTGPHLHFGVAVGQVEVDPVQWLDDGGLVLP